MANRVELLMAVCLAVSNLCAAQSYLSPSALVADAEGKTLYVVEETARQVAIFDVASKKVTKTIPVSLDPTGAALSPDGKTLYITGGVAEGAVAVVDVQTGTVTTRLTVGHTPMSPVVSPDGKTLYVCNRFNGDVSVVDLASGRQTGRIKVKREPVAAALTPDGKRLFVANHLPIGAADGDYIAAEVSVIDTATGKVEATLKLPNGSTALRGVCVSPDGKNAYVTHILARYHMPTTQLERGWMNTNALTVIDTAEPATINTVLLDNVDLGAANPWGVTCSADGKWVCVTQAGTHEVSVIDRAALHEKLAKVAAGEKVSVVSRTPDDVPNDLSFLVGMRRRLKLAGNGPHGVVVVGAQVFAAEYFTDSLGVVDTTPDARHRPTSLPLGPKVPLTIVRKGEMFFNDATLCFQHWQSCGSCHPDGRADGLNWDLLNDGMGNPKQTKSLLLSHKTPPVMMTGIRADAETAVRAGIKFILFAVRPEEDAVALDEYCKSMEPVPSPYLVDGKLSKAAKRGWKVYKKAGCASCHPRRLYTDFKKYDVGTAKGLDEGKHFDTPTVIENWRTGPLLYDGRAASMEEVITTHNYNDAHGKTSGLTPEAVADLVEFVLSQ